MDMKQIKQLIKLMIENDLTELDISSGSERVHLKRAGEGQIAPVAIVPQAVAIPAAPTAGQAAAPAKEEAPAEKLIEIRSPMVGTFYAATSPQTDPFASVGDAVEEETVVCIVEAMKVMNEIKADCAGTIAEVCVKNAQPVEYGQVLFRVKPAGGE